jgi:hypothetical protein
VEPGEAPDPPGEPDPPREETGGSEIGALTRTLRELADLHRTGALTDEEFQRAKDRVLGEP